MNRLFKLLVPALWAAFFFAVFPTVAESAQQKTGDAPHITQLLALADGRVIVVTVEKGGLYLATPERKKLQRLLRTPETRIHQATQDANGALYLATDAGIYRADQPEGAWEQVGRDAVAWLAFSADGAQSRVKRWGEGLFAAPSAYLSVEKVQEIKAVVAQRQTLREQVGQLRGELHRKIGAARTTEKTPEETRASLEKFAQLRKLEEQADNLNVEGGWQKISAGLPKAPVQTLAILPDGEEFAGWFGGGVYRSRNAGADWEAASTGLVSPWVLTLAASPRGDLYAGTFGAGLFRWRADVHEWTLADAIFAGAVIQDLAFGANGQILAGSRERGLFLSLDEGKTWRKPDGVALPGSHVQGVAVGANGAFWVSVWGRGLSISTDQGVSWRRLSFPQATQVTDLVFTPDGVGYAVLADSGLYYSTDGGRQWVALAMPEGISHKVRLAVTGDGRLWLGSRHTGLWTLAGPNASWERESAGLSGAGIQDFAVSPAGAVLAIAQDDGGLYERSASGEWRSLTLTLLGKEPPWLIDGVWKPVADVGPSLWRELSLDRLECLPDGRWVAIGYYEILLSENHGAVWRRYRFAQSFHDFLSAADGTLYTERFMVTLAQRRDSTEWDAPVTPRDAYRFIRPAGAGRWVAARENGGMDILSGDGVSLQVTQRELEGEKVLSLAVSPQGAIFAGLENELKVLEKDHQEWRTVDLE